MRTGILLFNKGKKGGAEKRYYNLINALSKKEKVYLLANSSIIDLFESWGGFNSNVIINILEKDINPPNIIDDKLHIPSQQHQTENRIKNLIKILIPKETRSFLNTFIYLTKLNLIVFNWVKGNQITHINTLQASGILAVFAKIAGVKIIFSYMDYMVENGYPFKWIENLGLKTVVKISDKLDFLSNMIPERIENKGLKLDKKKVFVAPISFTDYSKFRIKIPKRKKIIFSGRFEKIKNPLLALETAKILNERKVEFELNMIGYGKLESVIHKFITENELKKNVKVFSTNKIENELEDALIFLSLQKENNYPSQALLEAMAAGCIPVVTDVGETRKMVDESTAFFVGENSEQIADIVCDIFNNIQNYEQKSFEIREKVLKNFTVEKYLDYYRNLLNF